MATPTPATPFVDELEVFRREEESAQQYFFGFLSLRLVPHANPDVLRKMNETPAFWITTRYAPLMSDRYGIATVTPISRPFVKWQQRFILAAYAAKKQPIINSHRRTRTAPVSSVLGCARTADRARHP